MTDTPLPPPAPPPDPVNPAPARRSSAHCRRLAQGATLGALIGLAVSATGLAGLTPHLTLIAATIGACLGAGRRTRTLLWSAAAGLALFVLVVSYTPLTRVLLRGLERRDDLRPAPAVVALGAAAQRDGSLTAAAQERVLHSYRLLGQGHAPRLVLTRPVAPAMPWHGEVLRQMREFGLGQPVEVVGPAADTHDEAVAVARLARDRGWDSVILVTHPWHMRRAAAAFERAGLRVVCSPCNEGRHDLRALDAPSTRIGGFVYWLREAVAYRVYRARGWI
jgi:uncharacterized SAM-binding protein YcdF (DUF218 family)